MKSIGFICLIAITLFATLAIPVGVAAQDQDQNKATQNQTAQHHHYQLIDIGTFGGPSSSYGEPPPAGRLVNSSGAVVGGADTNVPDPSCIAFNFDCYVSDGFKWQNGVANKLDALPGSNSSIAFWITDNGLVAGISTNGIDPLTGGTGLEAILWEKDGSLTDLGTLGGNESVANAVNNRGQVAGVALNTIPDPYVGSGLFLIPGATQAHAFRWTESAGIQDLGTLGGADSTGVFINQRGQIAGWSFTNTTVNSTTGFPTLDPFLWENGKMLDLGTLGGTFGLSRGLNNSGQVVGNSNLAGDQKCHPFVWDKTGGMQDLGTLGGDSGSVFFNNDAGEVVGAADVPGASGCDAGEQYHAFFWKNGVMTDLGTADGDPCSLAVDINSKRQIVGAGTDCSNYLQALLWENGGPAADLNTLIPPNPGLQLWFGIYVNDAGEIAALGALPNGDTRAFVLIPCDQNHPDVQGCDYSMVDASAAAQSAAPRNVPSATQRVPQSRWNNRYHRLGLQSPSIAPQPDSSQPESTPCYVNPGVCITLTAQSPVTISPGGTVTYTVALEARGGFNGEVGLSCSVQPSPALAPTCFIHGLNNGKLSTGGGPVTMAVNTTGPTAAVVPFKAGSRFLALWFPLIGLVGTGIGLGSGQKKKKKIPAVVLTCMLFAGLAFLVACGSSSKSSGSPGTPAQTYTITVTGIPNGAPTVSTTTPVTVQ
jgi:probable HAF family extracellular repeat protein